MPVTQRSRAPNAAHQPKRLDDPDAALLKRIADRDPDAASALFDRYAEEMLRFLSRRMGPAETEDLLQEVFVRALRGASRFRGDASVRTWLYSIARFTLYERYRARSEAGFIDPVDGRSGPESLAIQGEHQRRVIAALERLPDELAVVLELHRIDGFSHREIADLLGITSAASRKRLERAVKELEENLESSPTLTCRHSRLDAWRHSLLRRVVEIGV